MAEPEDDSAEEQAAAPDHLDFEPTLASSAITPDTEPEGGPEPEAGPPPPEIPAAPEPPPVVSPSPEPRAYAPQPRPHRRRGLLGRLAILVLLITVVGPLLAVLAGRFIPVAMTPLMAIRLAQGQGWDYRWRSLSDISPSLVQAAVAAEDARFCSHHGFDFEAMRKAMAHNERKPGKVRGGSTISQQTAKNVFLWPDRSYIRKGLEAYFTVLTEAIWGKRRIMEVYLNVVEWGPGIYGAEAAARRYFGVDAADLTPQQASRLAAILPSPLKWKAVHPGKYVVRRSGHIAKAEAAVRAGGLAACVYR